MIDFDRHGLAPAFRVGGEAATYTAPDGAAVAGRVIRAGGGVPLRLGPVTVYPQALTFDVRAAEVGKPVPGAVLQIGGTGYTLTGLPYHPEGDAFGLIWSCPALWGTPILYRTPTGNGTTLNPPTVNSLTISTAAPAGAVALSIKATLVTGRVLAGDRLTVNGETYGITAPVTATSNVFSAIPLDRPLTAAAAVGAVVTLSFACDRPTLAAVAGYDASQLLGGIVVGDRRVIVMQERLTAAGIPTPTAADSVFLEGRWWRVKNAAATYEGPAPFVWDLECGG